MRGAIGPETEADFQAAVLELARLRGWMVHHTRPARTRDGWRTPIQGDAGFPDLVLARAGRIIFAELKAQRGRLSDGQRAWLRALAQLGTDGWQTACDGADPTLRVCVWRPSDWDRIEEALR